MRINFYPKLEENKGGTGGAGAGSGAGAGAGNGKGAAAAGGAGDGKSALSSGGEPTLLELIPERLRVVKDDKSLDLEASTRKLAGAYGELDKRLKAGDAPPATPEEYAVDKLPGDVKFEELRKDPKMQSWLKGAHAMGMNNAQVKHVVTGLLETLAADAELSTQETTAELQKHWKTEGEYKTHTSAAYRAANTIGGKIGLTYAQIDQALGNQPIFIRLMAAIGAEMKEDVAPNTGGAPVGEGDFETKKAELLAKLDKMPANDPQRASVLKEWDALFARRFKTAQPA